MSADAFEALTAATLADCTRTAFRRTLGLELREAPPQFPTQDGLWLSCSVRFIGESRSLLRLDLPHALARDLSAARLDLDRVPLDRAATDRLMEQLAGTLADLLRPALPGAPLASAPRAAETIGATPLGDPKTLLSCTFLLQDQPLRVTLWKCPSHYKL